MRSEAPGCVLGPCVFSCEIYVFPATQMIKYLELIEVFGDQLDKAKLFVR